MVHGQYTIPEGFIEPVIQPQVEIQQPEVVPPQPEVLPHTEAPQVSPEINVGPFRFIKDIEDRLDSYRFTAIEIEEAKRPWLKSIKSMVISPKPLLAELIDKESKIGGRLLQKQDQTHNLEFWSEGHEWFFGWSDGKNKKIENTTVHYQVTDSFIQKSYQGRIVPFTPGEETYFINAVQAYENAVRHELYPFDEALVELSAKDDFGLAA
jgi:hypothetical protein